MRRAGIFVTAGLGVVLVGLAAWCIALLAEVTTLRAAIDQRAAWREELLAVQTVLVDPSRTSEIPALEERLHGLDIDLLARRKPSDRLALGVAATIVDLRSLQSRPDDGVRRAEITGALGDAIAMLRGETVELSAARERHWTSLRIVALTVIGMAASLLAVTGYGLVVVAPRLRADTRRLTALHHRLEGAAMTGRGLGHELGGPLTSALTSLQLLRDSLRQTAKTREEHMSLLEEAITAMARASGTLQDLRSSSEANEEPPADVHAALDDALTATRIRQGGRARVTIDAERVGFAAVPQPVVQRLFTQILGNAVAEAADSRIVVRTRQERALISVEFGVGLGAAREESFSGLSRALAALGGSLTVRREQGAGVVRVELPPHAASESRPLVVDKAAPTAAPSVLRILLIDDDDFVLSSVARVLARHDLVAESDPTRAIDHAISRDFDLILCDVMMPGKTGIEVFDAVTAARPELASRFVFMSGGSTEREISEFLDHAPARIDKPFGADELRQLVARYTATTPAAS